MAAMLNVSITTTGSASLLPIAPTHPWRLRPWCAPRRELLKLFSLGLIGLLLLLLGRRLAADRICDGAGFVRTSMIVAALLSFAALANIAGCGGGGGTAAVQPAQIVTPPGTSTITITPSAKSASGQPLQLPVIQLTLTVN